MVFHRRTNSTVTRQFSASQAIVTSASQCFLAGLHVGSPSFLRTTGNVYITRHEGGHPGRIVRRTSVSNSLDTKEQVHFRHFEKRSLGENTARPVFTTFLENRGQPSTSFTGKMAKKGEEEEGC